MSTSELTPPAADAFTPERLHSVLASTERPPRASALSACLTFGWRGRLKIKHVPEQLIDVTMTPVLFLLMFTYLFGGALAGSTDAYLQYVLPGVLVQSVLFTSVYSGVTLNTDVTKGVVDRYRSAPIWRAAPLVGAVLGDGIRYVVASVITIVVALLLGYEVGGGVLGMVAGVALVVLFSTGLAWVFTTLGMLMRSPSAVMNTGFMALFPLLFLSNAFVEPSTLPSGLEAFVNVNPISHLIDAVRSLMEGNPDGSEIGIVFGSTALLYAVFAPLTVYLYRNHG